MRRGAAGSWVLVGELVVVVGVSLLAALSAWQHEMASGHWATATRAEVRWSAAATEVVRATYQDAGEGFVELTLAQARAERLDLLTSPETAAERSAARAYLRDLTASDRIAGVSVSEVEIPGGGYDLIGYLVDLRERDPDLVPRTIEAELRAGDAALMRARVLAVVTAVLVLAFVVLAARRRVAPPLVRRGRGRRPRRPRREAGASPDLVPDPWGAEGVTTRSVALIAFAAWLAVVLIPLLAAEITARGQRAGEDSTRLAVAVTRDLTSSVQYASFVQRGLLRADDLERRGRARMEADNVAQTLIGAAEVTAASLSRERLVALAVLPTRADGLDAPLAESLATDEADLASAGRAQADAFDRARRLGSAGNLGAVASLLAALAATASAVGLARRDSGRSVVTVAGLLLAGSVLAAGAAIMVAV